MQKNNYFFFLLTFFIGNVLFSAEDQTKKQRNPFCFPEQAKLQQTKKPEPVAASRDEQLNLINTETKWQVKTVLPASVIVQHKEDGQIREIALTGTNVCS